MKQRRLYLLLLVIGLIIGLSTSINIAQVSEDEEFIAFPVQHLCNNEVICARHIKIINPNDRSYFYIETDAISPLSLSFSPDGQILSYFSGDGTLHLFDMQTLKEIYQRQFDVSLSYVGGFSWSSDSQILAILFSHEYHAFPRNLHFLHRDTWVYEQVTEGMDVSSIMSWSPVENRLAFSANPSVGLGKNDIYLLDASTYEITNITNNPGHNYSPNWSSDGQRIVHTVGDNQISGLAIRDETEVYQVIDIDARWFGRPEWVLNDEHIVLFIQVNGGSVLHIVDIATGEVSLLDTPNRISGHDISGDGERIVYLTTRSTGDLCIIDLVTQDRQCFADENPHFWSEPLWTSG